MRCQLNSQEDEAFERFLREKAREAKQTLGFPATLFLRMLGADGGYKTAITLLSRRHPSDGFTDLVMLGRPDLTVEALVVESRWRCYFDSSLLRKAEDLLRKSNYRFTPYVDPQELNHESTVSSVGDRGSIDNGHKPSSRNTGDADDEAVSINALDDLQPPMGSPLADRVSRITNSFKRNPKIREAVLRRSNGNCEYCKEPGFEMLDGSRYVEAHHIIGLAQDGPDTMDNVIALCPRHHREAHYGRNATSLEDEFLAILRRMV